MKPLFLILFIVMMLADCAIAQDVFKCVDAEGNIILTSTPREGMKCKGKDSAEESRRSKSASSANLVDRCIQWSRESDDISSEINDLEKQRLELQKEQFETQKNQRTSTYGYQSNPFNDKMYRINKEILNLGQKRSLIQQDMRLHKCSELNQDLSKLNYKDSESPKSPSRRTTVIIRR